MIQAKWSASEVSFVYRGLPEAFTVTPQKTDVVMQVLFDNLCRSLSANESAMLSVDNISLLSRVSRCCFNQVVRSWRARLSGLVSNQRITRVLNTALRRDMQQAWFQIHRFNLELSARREYEEAETIPMRLVVQAVHFHCVELLRLLLAAGGSANSYNSKGVKVLFIAAMQGDRTVVNMLLKSGAALETRNKEKETPLLALVKEICANRRPAKCSSYDYQASVSYFFHKKMNNYAQKKACLQALIAANANVNAANRVKVSALMHASFAGNIEVMQMLLDAKADVNGRNQQGSSPISYALHGAKYEAVQRLLEERADLTLRDDEQSTPLLGAMPRGDVTCLHLLLQAKAGINDVDCEGNTPIMLAAYHGHAEAVRVLKEAGATLP